MSESALQAREDRQPAPTEATHPGRLVAPAVDIFENERAVTLLADMPGVAPEALEIDLNEGVLTLTGRAHGPAPGAEAVIAEEYRVATYQRKFTLSQSVDQSKIEARLDNGVLRLELPKVEKARPRKIQVQTH